jgi:TonB family protein
MKTIYRLLTAVLVLISGTAFAQSETPPECLNLEQIQQKIGFPKEAKQAGAHGKVIAKVTVNPSGKVVAHEITESPSQALSDAVSAHIEELKFTPAKKEGKPITSKVLVPINFDAGGSEKVFTSLEDALTTTEVVENLDLSGQKLTTLDPRIVRLKSLKVLNLDDNAFTSVPAVVGKFPQLRELELARNQLKSVPGFLKKMKNLKELDISGNQMSAETITKAREMLEHVNLVTD